MFEACVSLGESNLVCTTYADIETSGCKDKSALFVPLKLHI